MKIEIEITEHEEAAIQAYLKLPGMKGESPRNETVPEYLSNFVKAQIEVLVHRYDNASS